MCSTVCGTNSIDRSELLLYSSSMQEKSEEFFKNFKNACKENKLKVTPQRLEIYKELSGAKNHPSAEKIYRRIRETFHNISLDTVNRTLLKFAEIGLVDIVEGSGEPRRFDPDTKSHHHFICAGCNDIVDVYNQDLDRLKVTSGIPEAYTIISKRVVIHGICEKCRNK